MAKSSTLFLGWMLCIILVVNLDDIRAQNAKEVNAGDRHISIIPQPSSVEKLPGEFTLTESTKVCVDPENSEQKVIGEQLSGRIQSLAGFDIPVTTCSGKNTIVLTTRQASDTLETEGYSLSVQPDQIIIRANNPAGLFYGTQTIYQLLPTKEDVSTSRQKIGIPAIEIADKPRFSWRGVMLDVGRYFLSVDFIKKFIDYLAMHKLNTFHWHLTEDHGWRIEIKKYPKLTEVGAWREGTQIGTGYHQSIVINENPHGGYYTQDQIREVVAYAEERYVNIVPEIEMPGHSLAAIVAYPELSCMDGPFEMPIEWGIQENILCPSETTFTFLENVLTEVMELFPSKYIHIGGDEAPKTAWENSQLAQDVIKRENLADEYELQSYFIRRIEKFLNSHGRKIIGWDEILEGGLAPNAAVMSWRGIEGGIKAARQHHEVVMAPKQHLYFDYPQGEPYLEPPSFGDDRWVTTLGDVYSYEPIPAELSTDEAKYIIGVESPVWFTHIHSPSYTEYMTFPRAAALAEVAWTQPRQKEWDDFKRRMETQYKRYDDWGVNYAKSAYNVWFDVDFDYNAANDSVANKATVSFKTDSYNPQIYYTLDGSEPTTQSLKYDGAFEVDTPVTIKAATFKDGKRISKVSVCSVVKLETE